MRSRSSIEANSTTIFPFFCPRSTFTLVSKRSESREARSESAATTGRRPRPLGLGSAAGAGAHQRHDLLDRSHGEPLGHDAMGQPVLLLGVVHGQQRPRMTGGQHPGSDPALHRRRQAQQSQRVGHLRTGAPDPVGQLIMRALEVLEQLVVRGCLLQRVQLSPVQVLQECIQKQLLVVRGPDNGRDPLQTGLTARPPAPLAHDELVPFRPQLPHDYGLEQADFLDGGDQLRERVLVEHLTRLTRVRSDGSDRNLGEVRPRGIRRSRGRLGLCGCARLRHHGSSRECGHLRGGHASLGGHHRAHARRVRTCSGGRHLPFLRGGGNQRTEPTPQPSTTLTHWIPSEMFCWLFWLPVWAC